MPTEEIAEQMKPLVERKPSRDMFDRFRMLKRRRSLTPDDRNSGEDKRPVLNTFEDGVTLDEIRSSLRKSKNWVRYSKEKDQEVLEDFTEARFSLEEQPQPDPVELLETSGRFDVPVVRPTLQLSRQDTLALDEPEEEPISLKLFRQKTLEIEQQYPELRQEMDSMEFELESLVKEIEEIKLKRGKAKINFDEPIPEEITLASGVDSTRYSEAKPEEIRVERSMSKIMFRKAKQVNNIRKLDPIPPIPELGMTKPNQIWIKDEPVLPAKLYKGKTGSITLDEPKIIESEPAKLFQRADSTYLQEPPKPVVEEVQLYRTKDSINVTEPTAPEPEPERLRIKKKTIRYKSPEKVLPDLLLSEDDRAFQRRYDSLAERASAGHDFMEERVEEEPVPLNKAKLSFTHLEEREPLIKSKGRIYLRAPLKPEVRLARMSDEYGLPLEWADLTGRESGTAFDRLMNKLDKSKSRIYLKSDYEQFPLYESDGDVTVRQQVPRLFRKGHEFDFEEEEVIEPTIYLAMNQNAFTHVVKELPLIKSKSRIYLHEPTKERIQLARISDAYDIEKWHQTLALSEGSVEFTKDDVVVASGDLDIEEEYDWSWAKWYAGGVATHYLLSTKRPEEIHHYKSQ